MKTTISQSKKGPGRPKKAKKDLKSGFSLKFHPDILARVDRDAKEAFQSRNAFLEKMADEKCKPLKK